METLFTLRQFRAITRCEVKSALSRLLEMKEARTLNIEDVQILKATLTEKRRILEDSDEKILEFLEEEDVIINEIVETSEYSLDLDIKLKKIQTIMQFIQLDKEKVWPINIRSNTPTFSEPVEPTLSIQSETPDVHIGEDETMNTS